MQTIRIVFTHPETGMVGVTTPHPDADIMDVIKNDLPKGAKDVEVMDADGIPHPVYHAAWVKKPGKIDVDMDKARGIHMNMIRTARNKKLKETDEHYTRLHDIGDEKEFAKIKAHRQLLRDLPKTVDLSAAQDAAQLLKIWPSELS